MKVDDLVFSGADGKPLFRSARSVWSANDYARRLNEELRRSDCGTFHEWTLVRQECWPGPFAFFADDLVFIPWDWLASEKAEICADAFAFAKWDIPR